VQAAYSTEVRVSPKRFFALALPLLVLGCGSNTGRLDGRPARGRPDSRTAGILAGATKVETYRIDGRNDPANATPIKPGDPTVSGYAILARGKDQGRPFAAQLADILADEKSYSDIAAACFWPGVAFRVYQGDDCVDLVICFKCHNFYLGPRTDKLVMENASFLSSPNTARLVRLAKEAFPDDTEVQGLAER
jgi:hypothetical protein